MGGKSKSTSTSISGSAQAWAKPIATNAANQTVAGYGSIIPQAQQLGQNVAGLVPGLTSMFQNGNPAVKAAQGYGADVLSGKYMQGNPYLEQIIGKQRSSIMDAVNSQFSLAGRYGSGAHTGVLADSLADMESGLRYQDYNTQQGRMDQMAGLAPTLAQAGYIGLPELLQASATATEIPANAYTNQANALSALFNGGTQTQTQKSGGGLLGGVGSLLSGGAAIFSDRRLKRDIVKLGELEDGLGVYEYRYAWDDDRQVGVMADEVAALRPWALGPETAGFATVNYGAL